MISKEIKYLILHNISKNFDEMLNYLKLKKGSFYSHKEIIILKKSQYFSENVLITSEFIS